MLYDRNIVHFLLLWIEVKSVSCLSNSKIYMNYKHNSFVHVNETPRKQDYSKLSSVAPSMVLSQNNNVARNDSLFKLLLTWGHQTLHAMVTCYHYLHEFMVLFINQYRSLHFEKHKKSKWYVYQSYYLFKKLHWPSGSRHQITIFLVFEINQTWEGRCYALKFQPFTKN